MFEVLSAKTAEKPQISIETQPGMNQFCYQIMSRFPAAKNLSQFYAHGMEVASILKDAEHTKLRTLAPLPS
jgi:hypothetical protein